MTRAHSCAELKELDGAAKAVTNGLAELVLAVGHWPRPIFVDECRELDLATKVLVEQADELVADFIERATRFARLRAEELDP